MCIACFIKIGARKIHCRKKHLAAYVTVMIPLSFQPGDLYIFVIFSCILFYYYVVDWGRWQQFICKTGSQTVA